MVLWYRDRRLLAGGQNWVYVDPVLAMEWPFLRPLGMCSPQQNRLLAQNHNMWDFGYGEPQNIVHSCTCMIPHSRQERKEKTEILREFYLKSLGD
jgi:hypothetical protein